jgi:hypothetical protein
VSASYGTRFASRIRIALVFSSFCRAIPQV